MLRVEELVAGYSGLAVLRGVSLDVAAGEVVGLVGPNGSGKTTLFRAITRLVRPDSGRVLIDDADIADLKPRDLARRVAVVPQGQNLPVGFSVLDIVLMGRTPHLSFLGQESQADLAIAERSLTSTGSLSLRDRQVDELSGGERQNVIIARALAQEAPLMLLDEPTASLDIGHQIAIANLLRRLAHDHGIAILAAIHDLPLASLYCDRLVLINAGLVVASGSPGEVLTPANLAAVYGVEPVVMEAGDMPPIVLPVES